MNTYTILMIPTYYVNESWVITKIIAYFLGRQTLFRLNV